MIELNIIRTFTLDKNLYNKYYKYININYIKENYKDIYKVFKAIESYYNKYKDSEFILLTDLEAHYVSIYPVFKDSDRKELVSLLHKVEQSDVTESITAYLETHRIRAIAGELALVAFDVESGKKKLEDLEEVYNKLDVLNTKEKTEFINTNLDELYASVNLEKGYRWRLNFLNHSLGSLRKGDFGFIFARPETGKTTFLASEITNFVMQQSKPIIWFNNEEDSTKIVHRLYQAFFGITNKELTDNKKYYSDRFLKETQDLIKIKEESSMSMRYIDAICKEVQPGLIILDQIDKIKGYRDERYDLQMKELYQWARELAKKYGPVIGVCQAGGTGENKKWLTMNDVDSSHTAKQGEADFILGIGKSLEEGMSNIRFLNISKNKLLGDSDTLSELRHGKQEVLFNGEIARYEPI